MVGSVQGETPPTPPQRQVGAASRSQLPLNPDNPQACISLSGLRTSWDLCVVLVLPKSGDTQHPNPGPVASRWTVRAPRGWISPLFILNEMYMGCSVAPKCQRGKNDQGAWCLLWALKPTSVLLLLTICFPSLGPSSSLNLALFLFVFMNFWFGHDFRF